MLRATICLIFAGILNDDGKRHDEYRLRDTGPDDIKATAGRFPARPGSSWASRRVIYHEFAMADIQNPLPLEVWSRSRGHLLSKRDLWTPCVVDIAIR